MKYKVDIEIFEGPVDLLLHLINEAEIDIYDIPINNITEQFLDYLNKMEELNLEIASDFLVMAASLIEIKSKMLLPKKPVDEQMEMEEVDPRTELVERLIEYKKYKTVSQELKEKETIQSRVYYKPKEDIFEESEDIQLEGMDISKLLLAINNILKNREKKEKLLTINEIQREEYTLEECIGNIKDSLITRDEIMFTEMLNEDSSREEVVTYFLSILELTRMGLILVRQKEDFSDIRIINRKDEGLENG